jgi:purine-nucleoside phosphorylase
VTNDFTDPSGVAADAARDIARLTQCAQHDVALVLGSGWSPAADLIGTTVAEFPATSVAGFPPPAVAGHAGTIRSIRAGEVRALVLLGRTHLYEGRGVDPVVHGVRTAAAAGCRTVVLTNGCGSVHRGTGPGTPVLISDHLNLTGTTPLRGAAFLDLTDLYSARLRALCQRVERMAEGVYVQFRGPQYETPAEVRMAKALGGDLVGMSTALEAIAAREAGLEVLGISLVTNLAAGVSDAPLNHAEVLEAGRAAADRMGGLLAKVVRQL